MPTPVPSRSMASRMCSGQDVVAAAALGLGVCELHHFAGTVGEAFIHGTLRGRGGSRGRMPPAGSCWEE